jgi:transcriptional repressor of dcmA and dcmR
MSMRGDPGDLLDIKQAARLLRVSETSLRRWTNAGRLACLRIGRKRERRFRRVDLLALLEEQPALAPPPRHAVIGGMPMPPGTHLAGLYATDTGRTELAAGFLTDGLHPGSVCYLVGAPGVQREILTYMEQGRPALRTEIAAGRLVLSEHTASAGAQLDYFETAFRTATRAGAHSLRLVGDMWSARALAREGLVEFEAAFDELVAPRFPVVALCQYDVRRFSNLEVFHALQGHKDTFRYPVERVVG